ncbi:MAG: glycosyltransferase [Ruminococcus sp.]|nr:glycosyltransferase [Ruminococcus sp.]
MSKLRIAMITNSLSNNGISAVIKNYCEVIDQQRFSVTVIAGEPFDPWICGCLEDAGVRIVRMPERKVQPKAFYRALSRELSGKKYDIVHVHGNSCTIAVELLIARMKGIRARLGHSHNTTCSQLRAHKLLRPVFNACCTGGMACSEEAGKWLFENRPFTVLPNGFDTSKFVYDDALRQSVRREQGFEDKFVIGCVGRFNHQKNQPYLLRVFEQIAAQKENAVLWLIGDGPDLEKTLALIEQHPFRDRIVYYGESDRVSDLYNAMDVFVLPTRHEGLGIVFLEAQINGLYCVTSDQVPPEARLGETIAFLPLTEDVSPWTNAVLNAPAVDRAAFYDTHSEAIARYEITKSVRELERFYTTAAERK